MGQSSKSGKEALAKVAAAAVLVVLFIVGVAAIVALGLAFTMPFVALLIIAVNYFGGAIPLTWTSVFVGSVLFMCLRELLK